MELLPIDEWVNQLAALPLEEFTTLNVDEFVARTLIGPESLAPYVFYRSSYTRNLIYRSDLFEVLAICWDVGQQSLPHDHGGSHCWMVTPIGRLRVQNFRVEERDEERRTCRLTPTSFFDMDAAHPARVESEEPVHQVLNLPEFGERAASVHVYSRPYASCEVYDAAQGRYWPKKLDYHSEYGRRRT
jgi:cysteine dioxygenase